MEIPELDAIAREAQAADGGVALEPETYRAWTRQVIEAAERLGYRLAKVQGGGIQINATLAELGDLARGTS